MNAVGATAPSGGSGRRRRPTLVVAGATGSIGAVLLELLSTRADVWGEIRLVADTADPAEAAGAAGAPGTAGAPAAPGADHKLTVRGEQVAVRPLTEDCFDGADVALFALPASAAARWAPVAVTKGCVVVDSSDAFRLDPDVPLVVPEVNAATARLRPRGIVASPHGATLPMIVALGALHAEYGLTELVLASYLAASGEGEPGVRALRAQLAAVAASQAAGQEPGTHPGDVRRAIGDAVPDGTEGTGDASAAEPLALNVVPWSGTPAEEAEGWSSEEIGVRAESRKILGLPGLKVSATFVRVPVVTTHSLAVHAVFESRVSVERAHEILSGAPGVVVYDNPADGEFPTPVDAVGTDPTWVGRVRRSLDDPSALDLFLCGDNLRKGGALNSVQIAELVAADLAAGV